VAVLSIRKYLTEYRTDNTNPLLVVCRLLIQGIIESALPYDREEYREFRTTLESLASVLGTARDGGQLLAAAEAVCEALENYNRGAQGVQAAQTVELRCMIEMLARTLTALAEAGGQSVQVLQTIRTQVENARQLDDIRVLRARLGDSLKVISDEARRQREWNISIMERAEEAAAAASSLRQSADADRITEFPSVRKAEKEIAARISTDSRCYAAVFVVQRLENINLRYGYSVGDQLLEAVGRYLISKLAPSDRIFRWRGPTFMMLLDREHPADTVRAEVGRFASGRQEHTLEIEGRPQKLAVSCASSVIKLADCQLATQACQQIDRFVAEHSEK
jgi:GGDEF domain-containing protein